MKKLKNRWLIPETPVFIGDKKALKHKTTQEACLFGQYGEIWEYANDKIGLLITSTKIAGKYFKTRGSLGDEFFFIRPLSELSKYARILKVSKYLDVQLQQAKSKGKQ